METNNSLNDTIDLCVELNDLLKDPQGLQKIDKLKASIGYFYFVKDKEILEDNNLIVKEFSNLKRINGFEFSELLEELFQNKDKIQEVFNKKDYTHNIIKVLFEGSDFDLCFQSLKLVNAS